jgi:hypothetical protein
LLISIAMAYLKMQSKLLSDASLDKRIDLRSESEGETIDWSEYYGGSCSIAHSDRLMPR